MGAKSSSADVASPGAAGIYTLATVSEPPPGNKAQESLTAALRGLPAVPIAMPCLCVSAPPHSGTASERALKHGGCDCA